MSARSPKGPGLAKAGNVRLVSRASVELFRSADYGWRELFERADVMSEGAVRRDVDGSTYFGTTSLLLPFTSHGGLVPDALARDVVRLAGRDPHVRLRAVRVACLEARVRSVHPIGRIKADLLVRPDPRGIRLDVEVEATLAVPVRATRGRKARP